MTKKRTHRRREPVVYVEHDELLVAGGAVVSAKVGSIPAGATSTLLLGPGVSLTSAVLNVLGSAGTTVCVVGESGVRFRCHGQPWGGVGRLAERHAEAWTGRRELAAAALFTMRWGRAPLVGGGVRSISGQEGAMMKRWYRDEAERVGVRWDGRRTGAFGNDRLNDSISWAGACVNGLAATAVHAAGAIPQLGFIHGGGSWSFVYDIADLHRCRFVSEAFDLAGDDDFSERSIRHRCRDLARESGTVDRMINEIAELFG